jgi:hypothetical protein
VWAAVSDFWCLDEARHGHDVKRELSLSTVGGTVRRSRGERILSVARPRRRAEHEPKPWARNGSGGTESSRAY